MTNEERKSTIDQDYIPNMMREGLMNAAIERERRTMLKVFGVTEEEIEAVKEKIAAVDSKAST